LNAKTPADLSFLSCLRGSELFKLLRLRSL